MSKINFIKLTLNHYQIKKLKIKKKIWNYR